MLISNKTNYFNRYLKLKQNTLKSSPLTHNSKYQSTDKIKQETNNKQLKEDKSTFEILPYNQLNKRNDRDKKVHSNPKDLKIITKPQSSIKLSNDESQTSMFKGLISKKEIALISEEITAEHIDFFESKIKNILKMIDLFEKTNDLNQKPINASVLSHEEPQTERISNSINNKLSLPKTTRLINKKAVRHPSISSKDSTNHSFKNNNSNYNNQLYANKNYKENDFSRSRQNKNKQANSHYPSSSMKKMTQGYSQLVGIKQKGSNNNNNNPTTIKTDSNHYNINSRTKSSIRKDKMNQNDFYMKRNEEEYSSKTIRQKRASKIVLKKSLKEDSITSNEKNSNTLMNDSSINLIIDEYISDHKNGKAINKPLVPIPIQNFTKIKEIGMIMKGKCKSDRMAKGAFTHF